MFVFYHIIKKKNKTAYSYNGESKLITKKKKNYAYTRDAQFRDIICQNHVIVFKEGRIFFAKELKVDCKWTKGHTTNCLCICYQINKAKIIDEN